MNTRLNRFVTKLLTVLFAIGCAVEVLLPLLLRRLFLRYEFLTVEGRDGRQVSEVLYYPKLICGMAAGVFALLILWELRKMMRTVVDGNCFVSANVQSLKRMSRCAALIAVFMLGSNLSAPTLTAGAMTLVFIIAGLFSRVLAGVFQEAVRYKEENDLTI